MPYFTKSFLSAATERAVKTFAQTLGALLAATGSGLLAVDWTDSLSVAAMASVVSLLTSVASGGVGAPGPSLVREGVTTAASAAPAAGQAPTPVAAPSGAGLTA